ncbi:symmetrical bis(5'-nucleosyl)-tetraphosphatase [Veronia pacifica]|uniref:Bis(5'-nucleosyl)-tetraphosphatase, symmetrical n=1 Tax=Veronia pacifica TaxID=1080227 RepID=A0A1C3EQ01_9GAMM|nr:symmetrical bis(5'-nucleosyl)-tetraphosphatase [Veronia pacifica]ODA35321.1 bis(5'-nucleosyl)-tetraphosphatase (symmetrical) [Veronia pacifica]
MATYLVGDIQGCFGDLCDLLELVSFNLKEDHLYLAGDLVARGPQSLEVLRLIHGMGSHAHTVLGNHDLHLLSVANGLMKGKRQDKTSPIFSAPDRDELLTWLRHQPLLIHYDKPSGKTPGFVMTHAGIPPQWGLNTAKNCATEVEAILQGDDYLWLLENMYANQPDQWDPALQGLDRYRFIINAFTRMRYCDSTGALDMACKYPPSQLTEEGPLKPWFSLKRKKKIKEALVFGHWAALGGVIEDNLIGLDTGCVWGGSLTMLRWEDKKVFTVSCPVHSS